MPFRARQRAQKSPAGQAGRWIASEVEAVSAWRRALVAVRSACTTGNQYLHAGERAFLVPRCHVVGDGLQQNGIGYPGTDDGRQFSERVKLFGRGCWDVYSFHGRTPNRGAAPTGGVRVGQQSALPRSARRQVSVFAYSGSYPRCSHREHAGTLRRPARAGQACCRKADSRPSLPILRARRASRGVRLPVAFRVPLLCVH